MIAYTGLRRDRRDDRRVGPSSWRGGTRMQNTHLPLPHNCFRGDPGLGRRTPLSRGVCGLGVLPLRSRRRRNQGVPRCYPWKGRRLLGFLYLKVGAFDVTPIPPPRVCPTARGSCALSGRLGLRGSTCIVWRHSFQTGYTLIVCSCGRLDSVRCGLHAME